MPIKHLQAQRPAAFPCIGKLRKGGAKQTSNNGKEVMGKDLDHFRFATDDADAAAAFAAYYGPEPKAVKVFLPYATTDENFQAWMEEYRAGGLVRRCDGETCVFSRDAKGNAITAPTACNKQCACKQVGRLSIIIPELARMAYVMVETHSVYDIIQLTENLTAAQAMRGDLRGIPFILSRREREISTPTGDGKRARRTKSLLFIEPDPAWVVRQLESMRLAALPMLPDDPPIPTGGRRLLVDHNTGEILTPGAVDAGDWADDEDEDTDDGGAGYVSPFDDPAAGVQPPPPEQPAGKPAKASVTTVTEIYRLAREVYGDKWGKEKEAAVAQGASKGAVSIISDLTQREGDGLLGILERRLAELQETSKETTA